MLAEMASGIQPGGVDRSHGRRAAALIAGLTLFRIFYSGTLELAGDEAYYWLWSRRPDIGYYSKGPGVAWAIALSTRLFGHGERAVRLPAVLLSAVSSWLMYRLARRLFGPAAAFGAIAVAATVPLFLAGSLLMTIDPLSVAFWLAAAAAFFDAIETDRAVSWIGAGAAVAAGVLCKFTNLAQLVCFAVVALLSPEWRGRLRRPGFWVMTLVGLAGLLPPLAWNARHGWVTLAHLWQRGALDRPFRADFGALGGFLLGQAAVFSPVYTAALAVALARREWTRPHARALRFLGGMITPLPLFYAVISLNGEYEANWTAPTLAMCPMLLAGVWTPQLDGDPRRRRRAAIVVLAHALLAAVAHAAMAGPWLFGNDRIRRLGGAADLAAIVERERRAAGADFVIAGGYQLASLLSYYTPGHPEVFVPDTGRAKNQFAFWPGYAGRFDERDALLVTQRGAVPEAIRHQFREVRPVAVVQPSYRGRAMRPHHLLLLRGLRPADSAAAPSSESAGAP